MTRRSIGIDGYNLALPNGTGVATYGFMLADTLRGSGHMLTGIFGVDAGRDAAMREVMFYDRLGQVPPTPHLRRKRSRRILRAALRPFHAAHAEEVPRTDRVETFNLAERLPLFDRLVTSPDLFEVAHRHFRLYGRFLRLRVEAPPQVMHWTYPLPITLEGAVNIYTFHDLVPLRLPYTTLDAKQAYRKLLAGCIAHGQHICTVSEASRSDIIAEFSIDPAFVTNTYQASPLKALDGDAAGDAEIIENIFGLKCQGYFLHFGAIEPKKNIGRLLEAYLSIGSAAPLVMTGSRGWHSEEELRLLVPDEEADTLHGKRMAERVRRLEHLPRPLLTRLIRGARAVLFPSIHEGFGLPVLEAMQLGTPVLTSNRGALAEIACDAALLVDPYDVGAIAAGIRALDNDAALRMRLGAAGLTAAGRFSIEAYRARLDRMYDGLLGD
ncbi:glycosyltransferase family 4 protein [Sphingomonas crusticola]|uniref:glycosyltransferase family 4 protein n=1 Tax=Sphingomonas crusticola TaxID=1697973 RepID=UPI000E2231ED|nr:glycosyltransferase family 1 protein [Sphingomonas crusticola]